MHYRSIKYINGRVTRLFIVDIGRTFLIKQTISAAVSRNFNIVEEDTSKKLCLLR